LKSFNLFGAGFALRIEVELFFCPERFDCWAKKSGNGKPDLELAEGNAQRKVEFRRLNLEGRI
jgi:hypothetical protein